MQMLGELILSIVLIVIAALVLVDTSGYHDFGALSVIGPEFLPNLIAYFFLIAAAVFLIKLAHKVFIKKENHTCRQKRKMSGRHVTAFLKKTSEQI